MKPEVKFFDMIIARNHQYAFKMSPENFPHRFFFLESLFYINKIAAHYCLLGP